MNNKLYYGLAFAAGLVAGVVGSIVVDKIRSAKEEIEVPEHPELLYFQNQKKEEIGPDPELEPVVMTHEEKAYVDNDVEELKEAYSKYHKVVKENNYDIGSEEDPVIVNKIEIISKKEFDDDLDGFDRYEEPYQYFPDTDELTNEDGELLEPMGYYIGDRFDKVKFQTNEWDEIYIKNYGMNEKYRIVKQREITKEDFFNY